jgi:two-component system LytT family response regulator/two-component system response regulator LytT
MSAIFKTVLVDDEPLACDELRFLLKPYADIDIIGEADSGAAALELIKAANPQVIFLDVQMRGLNGYETAKEIRRLSPDTLIVFATAYDDYAVKAFEIDAIDYLLKPFETLRIAHTVERIRRIARDQTWQTAVNNVDAILRTQVHLKKLPVLKQNRLILIDFRDIVLACTVGGGAEGVEIVTGDAVYSFEGTLTDLEDRLQHELFLRIHKSYIVNLEKIIEVIPWFKGTYWLKMADRQNSQVPVSKLQIKKLKKTLGLN